MVENQKCPVCSKLFKDDDDIVYCPVCGTPCHRDCYNKIGACPNANRHKDGFIYSRDNVEESVAETKDDDDEIVIEQTDTDHCEKCGSKIQKGAMFCTNCGARQTHNMTKKNSVDPRVFVPAPDIKYERSNEKIDDVPLADVACVVGKNADKYIPKFIRNRKIGWNWSAFLFGSYYFYYRKMTIWGVLVMALNLIAEMVTLTFFSAPISALTELLSTVSSSQDLMNIYSTDEFMNIANELAPAYIIIIGIMLIIHIFIAIFADYIYKRKVVNIIKKTDTQLDDGNTFVVNTSIIPEAEQLNIHDIRRMFLARKGGTNLFAPFLAFLILHIITSFLGL